MTAIPGDSCQNAFKDILNAQFREKIYNGFINDAVLPVLKNVMAYAHDIVDALERSNQSPAVACGPGCSYCCHSQIHVLPIEALLILSFIHECFTGEQILLLMDRIEQRLQRTRGQSIGALFSVKSELPCIFLENGMCSIYQVRPFICRAWNSMDSSLCKKIFNSGKFDDEIESSSARNFVFESSRSLFVDFGNQLKLETVPFEMTRAVFNCLKTTNPLPLWLSGQDILNVDTPIEPASSRMDSSGDHQSFEADSDRDVQTLPVSREQEYIDYFYGKYKSRLAGYGYAENHSQVHSFVFQNVYGKPVGAIALNEVVSQNRTVHIHHLKAFVLQSGNGTLMLLELCRKADCFNIRLSANPAFDPNDEFFHSDFKVLSNWYEQFGFKGDSGLCRIPRQG
ncbi:YkgJ family cysteine cluster protein [Desulfobacter hydrogenophilus]|uniref:YkgJ family cysteine cluster protein n=1 Tax=Desulfobacter hydrogenophilus TaxID=2291 RepID=A0A328FE65_9BACT|nr:YkgJ family cysteine cluster protein [Desulfobacter hydrogenophilus]NDY72115.1 YkgJ family cysteine cluster protein [Desulfobacter hydrogenophilus]QBH14840.1 YkgJ family cysteine cluster protein [Desulfobacter hydrogenophilus]RAM01347.1 YkgJ family cysteine cluster protein [Desulfobacter hydrogenophilus]